MNDPHLFERLCQSQVEGTATDGEHRQLAGLLDASEEARDAYLRQMRVHALLTWQHGRSTESVPALRTKRSLVPFPRKRRVLSLAALVVLSFAAVGWLAFRGEPPVAFEVVATTGTPFRVGERTSSRMLELANGSLGLRLESGAVIDVAGPAKVALVDATHLRVFRGTVTVDISDGSKGFVVETDQARIVDMGTRFSVAAVSGEATDVVVFEGEVDVFEPPGDTGVEHPVVTLGEGDAIRIQKSHRSDRLRMVPLRPDARSLEAGSASDIVTDIEDNISGPGFRGYYGLVRGSFGEGARAYTTGHTRTWHPMPGETFPGELLGADGICTFGTDRKHEDLQITLHVSRPCIVYVMVDARGEPPSWVVEDFADTGFRLRAGPWIPRKTPKADHRRFHEDPANYIPYKVWKRQVDTPGPVTLGTSQTPARPRNQMMYGIAVKAIH